MTAYTKLGSSPLSRGIQAFLDPLLDLVRIIPALAGNTYGRAPRGQRWRDHPRSRGEYLPRGARSGRPGGSSPLSRGIRVSRYAVGLFSRIIPALAGNTHRDRLAGGAPGDHPRSRGEYHVHGASGHGAPGSSPLSRGIHVAPAPAALSVRIIPALAGNTWRLTGLWCVGWDHPRSRGEYCGL